MGAKDYAGDVARGLAFLSRIPMPQSVFDGADVHSVASHGHFPQPASSLPRPPPSSSFFCSLVGADALMSALLALGVQCLITGALHEDGLSDAADGLGGGRDREHALSIMKDSRIGTYGAIALILSLGLRAAALAALVRGLPPLAAALTLPAAAALSRGAMVWHWTNLPAAKADGVAARAGQPSAADAKIALVAALLLSAAALVLPTGRLLPFIAAVLVTAAGTLMFTAYIRRRLSGHTGDTIGATQQICDIAVFCALALSV